VVVCWQEQEARAAVSDVACQYSNATDRWLE